jgi:membrane protein
MPGWATYPARAVALFLVHNGPGMAATVAFFGFLSLVPLVLLLLAFLGGAFGGLITPHEAQTLFRNAVPGLSRVQFQQAYWEPIRHSKTTTTVLGAASLFLGTLGLHDAVDWAVNRLWEAPQTRPFWLMKLRGLAVIVWVIAFALFSIWLTWLVTVVAGVTFSSLAAWLALLPSVLVDGAIFTALYRLTPTVEVQMRPAVIGALVATALWELSKVAFAWWVVESGSYNRVYGPLAASVVVMLWVWISAMIFLYGAALSVVLQRSEPVDAPHASVPD